VGLLDYIELLRFTEYSENRNSQLVFVGVDLIRSSLKLNLEFIKESLEDRRFSYGFLNKSVNQLSDKQYFRMTWLTSAIALRVVGNVLDYPMSSTNASR
jgi:hypothetical protein